MQSINQSLKIFGQKNFQSIELHTCAVPATIYSNIFKLFDKKDVHCDDDDDDADQQ